MALQMLLTRTHGQRRQLGHRQKSKHEKGLHQEALQVEQVVDMASKTSDYPTASESPFPFMP
jgi:hypothetical protein